MEYLTSFAWVCVLEPFSQGFSFCILKIHMSGGKFTHSAKVFLGSLWNQRSNLQRTFGWTWEGLLIAPWWWDIFWLVWLSIWVWKKWKKMCKITTPSEVKIIEEQLDCFWANNFYILLVGLGRRHFYVLHKGELMDRWRTELGWEMWTTGAPEGRWWGSPWSFQQTVWGRNFTVKRRVNMDSFWEKVVLVTFSDLLGPDELWMLMWLGADGPKSFHSGARTLEQLL